VTPGAPIVPPAPPIPMTPAPGSGQTITVTTQAELTAAITANTAGGALINITQAGTYTVPPAALTTTTRISGPVATPPVVVFDGTGQDALLAQGGAGFWVCNADAIFDNITVQNVGLTHTTGDFCGAIRLKGGNYLTLNNCLILNSECGVTGAANVAGTSPPNLTMNNSTISGCGLTSDGLSHDVYWEGNTITLTNCLIENSGNGHAVKSRSYINIINGGTLGDSPNNTVVDIPNGGTLMMSGVTVIKGNTTSDVEHGIIGASEEGLGTPNVGPTVGSVTNSVFECADLPTPFFLVDTGTLTIDAATMAASKFTATPTNAGTGGTLALA
jgi:hypothetical protein